MQERTEQRSLFDLEVLPKEKKYKPKYWYYLTRRRNTEMMYGIADDGTLLWCEHDTRDMGVRPYLFNTWHTANKRKIAYEPMAEVKSWKFKR